MKVLIPQIEEDLLGAPKVARETFQTVLAFQNEGVTIKLFKTLNRGLFNPEEKEDYIELVLHGLIAGNPVPEKTGGRN